MPAVLYYGDFYVRSSGASIRGHIIRQDNGFLYFHDGINRYDIDAVEPECPNGGYPLCKDDRPCPGCPKVAVGKIENGEE